MTNGPARAAAAADPGNERRTRRLSSTTRIPQGTSTATRRVLARFAGDAPGEHTTNAPVRSTPVGTGVVRLRRSSADIHRIPCGADGDPQRRCNVATPWLSSARRPAIPASSCRAATSSCGRRCRSRPPRAARTDATPVRNRRSARMASRARAAPEPPESATKRARALIRASPSRVCPRAGTSVLCGRSATSSALTRSSMLTSRVAMKRTSSSASCRRPVPALAKIAATPANIKSRPHIALTRGSHSAGPSERRGSNMTRQGCPGRSTRMRISTGDGRSASCA